MELLKRPWRSNGADLTFLLKEDVSLIIRRLSFNSNANFLFLFFFSVILKLSKSGEWLQGKK